MADLLEACRVTADARREEAAASNEPDQAARVDATDALLILSVSAEPTEGTLLSVASDEADDARFPVFLARGGGREGDDDEDDDDDVEE